MSVKVVKMLFYRLYALGEVRVWASGCCGRSLGKYGEGCGKCGKTAGKCGGIFAFLRRIGGMCRTFCLNSRWRKEKAGYA